MSFRRFVCWNPEDVPRILRIGALESSDAVFMATHVPIENLRLSGPRSQSVQERTERGVLDFLQNKNLTHAFCLAEGEPGCGKSHLIRWLSVNWQSDDDLVVLVPKSQGSLEGTLQNLRERLPVDLRGFFSGLGEVKETSLEGRARNFQAHLANSMVPGYFTKQPPPDAKWAEDWKLSLLIAPPQIVGKWEAPKRILEVLSGMGGQRHSRVAEFTLFDIVELSGLLGRIDTKDFGPKATMFKRKLAQEAKTVRELQETGADLDGISRHLSEHSDSESVKLVTALNRRLNATVQGLLGISGQSLKKAFFDLREELARRKKRLVLLLEDITSMQGVEDQLIDVLIAPSEEEKSRKICDLVSVAGITPQFLTKLPGMARGRITLTIRFGDSGDSAGLEQTASLATAPDRHSFSARYLQAVRVGLKAIEQSHFTSGDTLPNPCTKCNYRPECHAIFGALDGVGFYPFTIEAVDRIYQELRDPEGTMSLQTPRGMLTGVVGPVLTAGSSIESGQFPAASIETEYLPSEERHLLGRLEQIVEAQIPDRRQQDRMRRLIAWWGRRNDATTSTRSDGSLEFAGVAKGVFETFELPWLGGIAPLKPPDEKVPIRKVPPRPPVPSQLQQRLTQINSWLRGESTLAEPTFWITRLFELIEDLPWRALGIDPWVQRRLFTRDTVQLEGVGKTDIRHFVLPREDWIAKGLAASVALKEKGLDPTEKDFHRRMLARMMRRMGKRVVEHVANRIPDDWSPAVTASEILMIRHWLMGSLRPTDSLSAQWNAILDDEPDEKKRQSDRVEVWRELLVRTGNTQSVLRDLIRTSASLPQDPAAKDSGFTDAGAFATVLVRFADKLTLTRFPAPESKFPEQLKVLNQLIDVARYVDQRVQTAILRERDRLLDAVELVLQACDDLSLPEYLSQVDNVISELGKIDPYIPAAPTAKWNSIREMLISKDLFRDKENSGIRLLDDCLASLTGPKMAELKKAQGRELLSSVLAIPSADLTPMSDVINDTDDILNTLKHHVDELLKAVRGHEGMTLTRINEAGASIRTHSKTILDALKARTGHA